MADLLKTLFLGLALTVGPAALAQTEQPVADAPPENAPYVAGTFDDWEMRCEPVANANDRCHLYQLLKDQNGNSVAEISIFGMAGGGKAAAGVTVITPLATMLPPGVTMKVDDGKEARYPFTFCAALGCFSRFGLTSGEVTSFKRGNNVAMQIVPAAAADQRVDLKVSLTGFTAAFEAVNAANGVAQ